MIVDYSETYIKEILKEVKTIAVVGASGDQDRDSYKVMESLIQHGYQIFHINPNEEGNLILGQLCYADLSSVSGKIDMVDVFRAEDAVIGVAKEAIKIGAKVLWTQLDIINEEASELAKKAGLKIKINAVALKGINDNEILNLVNWCGENKFSLTFIEVMPMGEIGEKRSDQYMPLTEVKSLIQTKYSLTEDSLRTGGPARYVHCHETDQKIGFITPHTHNFCELCNRVRITCTGEMYMCLGQQDKADLKTPLRKSENDQLLKHIISVSYTHLTLPTSDLV